MTSRIIAAYFLQPAWRPIAPLQGAVLQVAVIHIPNQVLAAPAAVLRLRWWRWRVGVEGKG